MLKKFILNMLSSFVGTWIAIMLLGVVIVLLGIGVAARLGKSSESPNITKNSIMVLDLKGDIEEVESPVTPDYHILFENGLEKPHTLQNILNAIREAKDNNNISGIYLKCGGVGAGIATLDAIRDELLKFKESKKTIYAYGDQYRAGDYYLASVADSIFINPYGSVELKGIGGVSLYFKSLFDKLGIKFQVIKVGTYKSAVEPFTMDKMSEPAKAQLDTLYGNMWLYIRQRICENRKNLTPVKIDSLVNNVSITFASIGSLLESGLVDAAVYERLMDGKWASKLKTEKKKLNFVGESTVGGIYNMGNNRGGKNQIALLYACGEIQDGASSGINFEQLVPIITDLAENEDVKGMVLRVNSPGGSAFGSDQIGEALDYFQSKGKILAVSMGDYAASGGYWISCGADRIFADPLTVTGSIGIFGLIPNGEGLLEKIGINPQMTGTNPSAQFPSVYKGMDETQLDVMQKYVERGYDRFVDRVAKGRKMPEEKVRRIAEGRVWDAMKAKEIGLVDELGGLQDAIKWVADKCKISKNYSMSTYPEIEKGIWDLILSNSYYEQMQTALIRDNFSELSMRYIREFVTREPVQARMLEIKIGLQ